MPDATATRPATIPPPISDNAGQPLGSFVFVLHAHVPYVLGHGQWPSGADWLYEAAAETYIPLLNVFHRLIAEGVTPRMTIGFTPIVCEMLTHLSFADDFGNYLNRKTTEAARNAREFAEQGLETYRDIAFSWESWYTNIARDFEQKYNRDIVDAFRRLQDNGHLEIITGAATHAYLPLLGTDEAVHAQIQLGVDTYKRHFGRPPRGIWLPECAYHPRGEWTPPAAFGAVAETPRLRRGIEEFLTQNHLEYFITEAHLARGGAAEGIYAERFGGIRSLSENVSTQALPAHDTTGTSEPTPHEVYRVASSGAGNDGAAVACFTRDAAISRLVWGVKDGYSGHDLYLDLHKKHFPGGLRLWRVTTPDADLAQKETYDPFQTREICEAQATHFVESVKDELRAYRARSGRAGVVCCVCDARLLGHWWFEGPNWLTRVLKKMWQDPEIDLTSGGRHLDSHPPAEAISLAEGSWGEGGAHYIWLNPDTAWTWREIYACEKTMTRLASTYGNTPNPKLREILRQCARELLLAQSSDWQFLISTVTARDYAALRCAGHINVFQRLAGMADKVGAGEFMTEGEREFLRATTERDSCFSDFSVKLWAGVEAASGQ